MHHKLIYFFYSENDAPNAQIKDEPAPLKKEEKKSQDDIINPGDLRQLKRGPQVVVIRKEGSSDTCWLVWNCKTKQVNAPERRMFSNLLKTDQRIEPKWIEAADVYEKVKAQKSEPQEK